MENLRILITGCSGGGKSTLLAELERRGFVTVMEPGRRIIAEEQRASGAALPWVDAAAFARRAIAMSRADLASVADRAGLVFFDRGLIDAAVGLERTAGVPIRETLGAELPYAKTVFLAPPWPEIFVQDQDRRHGMKAALVEYDDLVRVLPALGYEVCALPKVSVQERAAFVLNRLQLSVG